MQKRLTRHIKYHVPVIACVLTGLIVYVALPVRSADSKAAAAALNQRRKPDKKNVAVTEWFKKYDQIRREAEETTRDKYQSLFLGESKPDKKNAELASRMVEKYAVALAAMKRLPSPPETKQLHNGYIEYFGSARQLFIDFLKGQKIVPYSVKRFAPAKNRLEALDKTNKRIDGELRKTYGIPKHKHI